MRGNKTSRSRFDRQGTFIQRGMEQKENKNYSTQKVNSWDLFLQVNVTQDKKKIEKTFQEYERLMVDIQKCLKFIDEGMKQLQQHDLSVLTEARKDSVRVARVVQLATTGGGSARAIQANSKASGMMQGLALGLDMHFTQGKDGDELKKGHGSKLAKKIRSLAADLTSAFDELMQLRDFYSTQVSV